MPTIIIALIISYVIGSVPTAYIFGRVIKGIDIRNYGSGNVGATNALRVLGRGAGIAVLIIDILKGFIAVVAVGNAAWVKQQGASAELLAIMLGVACIVGHNWTIFLRFKGGKGIATCLGVLIALAISIPGMRIVLPLVVMSWTIVFVLSRIVSLSSVIAAVVFPFYMIMLQQSDMLIIFSACITGFVIMRHRSNLIRIVQGKEQRIDFRKKASV